MTIHEPTNEKPSAADLPLDLASAADECAEEDPTAAVYLFHSLADLARLTILRHLALGEHRVVDLTAHLGLAQSTTSAHLACLRDCGLVSSRTVGRSSMYSLAVGAELIDLLAAAERLLAVTGDAVTLCPTNHAPTAVSGAAEGRAVSRAAVDPGTTGENLAGRGETAAGAAKPSADRG